MRSIEADLAIIGAGPAGLAAAIAAAEAGVDAVVFEKASTVGGTANMGMGPFGVESNIQKKRMVRLTKEEAFQKFMDYTHWRVDAQLVRNYFWKSGDTINWLEDMGVEFAGVAKFYPGSEETWHVVQPQGGGRPGPRAASAMTKVMYERAAALGVKFYFDSSVTKILKEEQRISGLMAVNTSGEEYKVTSKAVIVCTGGFGDNPEMIKEYCGYTWGEDMFNFRIPGITGDGLRLAWEVGAAKGNMEIERNLICPITQYNLAYLTPWCFLQPNLVVNLSGDRVMDESILQNSAVSANVAYRQQNHTLFSILDDSIVKHFRKHGVDFPNEVFPSNPAENFDNEIKELVELYPQLAYAADSPQALAEQLGVDATNFLNTLDEYNECCDLNYDDYFCKPRRYLRPLRGKKFYAMRLAFGGYGSVGGIKINHKFEVLTDDYKAIPGFFGAGSDVCDIYAGTYLYYLPGNSMGFAVNSGRMAGENAASYVENY